MGDDYMWEPGWEPENTITLELNENSQWADIYTVATNNVFDNVLSSSVVDQIADRNIHIESDIVIERDGIESVKVLETMMEQKLQIQALTDMIGEMVKTKNFDIEWDLEKRVEQKKFLNKLGEDPKNDL